MMNKEDKIELHTHTTASDGQYTPAQLVQFAAESGIRHLAITDHDSTAGLTAALKEAAKLQVNIIPGIEISAMHLGREIHFLGYYLDQHKPSLQNRLKSLFNDRQIRAERMLAKFNALGYPMKLEEVKAKAGPQGLLGRPHFALVLMDYGIVSSVPEAFDKFLNPGCPGYVARVKVSAREAIGIIAEAQGIPVLAHPGLEFPLTLLPECLEAGLKGIECYHPRHTQAQTDRYLEIAKKYNLIVTGGSDFHGYEREDWQFFGNISPLASLAQMQQLKEEESNG